MCDRRSPVGAAVVIAFAMLLAPGCGGSGDGSAKTGGTASFTGRYVLGSAEGIPFDFELDYATDPAGLDGTFGGVPASCTIDLATFDVTC